MIALLDDDRSGKIFTPFDDVFFGPDLRKLCSMKVNLESMNSLLYGPKFVTGVMSSVVMMLTRVAILVLASLENLSIKWDYLLIDIY